METESLAKLNACFTAVGFGELLGRECMPGIVFLDRSPVAFRVSETPNLLHFSTPLGELANGKFPSAVDCLECNRPLYLANRVWVGVVGETLYLHGAVFIDATSPDDFVAFMDGFRNVLEGFQGGDGDAAEPLAGDIPMGGIRV